MTRLKSLRSGHASIAAVLSFVWAITFGALRDFVWTDIHNGLIDLRGFSRATRLIVLLGFALIFILAVLLLFGNVWRMHSTLISMPTLMGMAGRGRLVPLVLVPVTYLLLALAWAFALNGLLHSHWLARAGILILYLLAGLERIAVLIPEVTYSVTPPYELLLRGGLLLCVPVFYALRWRRPERPALEFIVLLALVTSSLAITQLRDFEDWQLSGTPLLLSNLESDLLNFRLLASPLLLLIGIDVANFTRKLAGWTASVVHERLPAQVPGTPTNLVFRAALGISTAWIILIVLVAWHLTISISELVQRLAASSWGTELPAYAGALGMVALLGAWVWLAPPRHGFEAAEPEALQVPEAERWGWDEEALARTVERAAPLLVLAYLATQLLAFVLLLLAGAFPYASFARGAIELADTASSQFTTTWHLLVYAVALCVAIWLRRRFADRPTRLALALYLGAFSLMGLWLQASSPSNLLQGLFWQGPQPLDFWWTLLIGVAVVYWLVRRRLTPDRSARLFFAMLVVLLLRQTSFIESPFSPLFGFAGVGFLVFGICWDVLTGGTWVNTGSTSLPRVGRVFLYVGYTLLTVALITWSLGTHDLGSLSTLTGGAADAGFGSFGRPLLYTVTLVMVLGPHRRGADGAENAERPEMGEGRA